MKKKIDTVYLKIKKPSTRQKNPRQKKYLLYEILLVALHFYPS